MFLQRVAAGLVFSSGAAVSKAAVSASSWAFLGLGFVTMVGGMAWLSSGGRSWRTLAPHRALRGAAPQPVEA